MLSTGGDWASTMVNSSAIDYDCRIVGYQCRGQATIIMNYRGYEFIDSNLSFILSVESKDRGGLGI